MDFMMQDVGPLKGMFEGVARGQGFYEKDLLNKQRELANIKEEAMMPWDIAYKAGLTRQTDLANQKNAGTLESDIKAGNAKNEFSALEDSFKTQALPMEFYTKLMAQQTQASLVETDNMIAAIEAGVPIPELGAQLRKQVEASPMPQEVKQQKLNQLDALIKQFANNPQGALKTLQASRERFAQHQIKVTPEMVHEMNKIMVQLASNEKIANANIAGQERVAGIQGAAGRNPNKAMIAADLSAQLASIEEQLKSPTLPPEHRAKLEADKRRLYFMLQVQMNITEQGSGIPGTGMTFEEWKKIVPYGVENNQPSPQNNVPSLPPGVTKK